MSVQVSDLQKRFAGTVAAGDVSFSLEEGSFLALLGPSGSGKTTVLRMIAGLETPDAGRITIDDRVVFDQGHSVPPEQRDVGMVFQDYALWPHMTVAQNIAFGLGRGRVIARKPLTGARGAGAGAPCWAGGTLSRSAFRRPATAGSHRARHRHPPAPAPAGRAALQPRRRLARGNACRVGPPAQSAGHYRHIRHHDRIEALAMADSLVVLRDGHVAQVGTPRSCMPVPSARSLPAFWARQTSLPARSTSTPGVNYACSPRVSSFGA